MIDIDKDVIHLDSKIKQAVLDFLYDTGRMEIGLNDYMRGVTHTASNFIITNVYQEEKIK